MRTRRAREGLASSVASIATTTAATKRRRLNAGDLNSSSLSPYVPLVIAPAENDERCSSPSSIHTATSCCSSNGSSLLAEEEENFKFIDFMFFFFFFLFFTDFSFFLLIPKLKKGKEKKRKIVSFQWLYQQPITGI